jgi:hypothetical protein
MDLRIQRLFALSGLLLLAMVVVGFLLAGLMPPPAPNDSAPAVASYFARHVNRIRIGMLIVSFAGALVAPWSVAISLQLRRISPRHAGYAYAELILGALLLVEVIVPAMVWEVAAFRPETSPAITMRLNDLASLMLVGVVATAVVQATILGIAILTDPGPAPVFRRWVGHFNLVIAVLFIPGGLSVFAKTGVLAYNGLISWWFALAVFGAWIAILTLECLRAIDAEERESESAPGLRAAVPR